MSFPKCAGPVKGLPAVAFDQSLTKEVHTGSSGLVLSSPQTSMPPAKASRCFQTTAVSLFLLEPLAAELKRTAILGDRPHDMLRCSGWHLSLYFQCHRHLRPD